MFKNYEQLVAFFHNRKNLGIKPGLGRMNQLLQLLDNPQTTIKAVHIAGTNGKGSTVSYLKNALILNGYTVGVFASPSLTGLTGHIFCNDKEITEEQFLVLFNEIYPAILELDRLGDSPTEFEIITVLAFVFFASSVDIALIEAGMGGREDTTNCFQPDLSIITNIAKDHTAFLGETIEEIAYHKAGIIKENVPVVIGKLDKSGFLPIYKEATMLHAPIYELAKDFSCDNIRHTNKQQVYTFNDSEVAFEVTIQMHGMHQVENSSLAIKGLVLLEAMGLILNWEKVLVGLERTIVPGRFEVIKENPVIVLDGAHNPAGIAAFLQTIDKNYPEVERHLIFAAFKDKELKVMLDQLTPYFTSITVTSFANERAASAEDLYHLIDSTHKYIVLDWKELLDKLNGEEVDGHYFITGSLHFIANIRRFLQEHAIF